MLISATIDDACRQHCQLHLQLRSQPVPSPDLSDSEVEQTSEGWLVSPTDDAPWANDTLTSESAELLETNTLSLSQLDARAAYHLRVRCSGHCLAAPLTLSLFPDFSAEPLSPRLLVVHSPYQLSVHSVIEEESSLALPAVQTRNLSKVRETVQVALLCLAMLLSGVKIYAAKMDTASIAGGQDKHLR